MRGSRRAFLRAPDLGSDAALARALGLALTGERLPLDDPATLAVQLEAAGFGRERLSSLRAERQAGRLSWPFPVPVDELRGLGFARFDAALAEARESLGLAGLHSQPQASRPLDRDEQRLSAERPPHWG